MAVRIGLEEPWRHKEAERQECPTAPLQLRRPVSKMNRKLRQAETELCVCVPEVKDAKYA